MKIISFAYSGILMDKRVTQWVTRPSFEPLGAILIDVKW